MIHHLDRLLRDLFASRIAELASEHVHFRPPDDDWRGDVTEFQGNALNIYLFDLRENRQLRSNERVRSIDNGTVTEEPSPARVDCHYLITAWTSASSDQIAWVQDQHALLYQAMAVLMNHVPLNPSRIYPTDSSEVVLADLPELIREADLPTQILPVEGFPKYAEFWGTMGTGHRWKPAIYLVVTLPVAFDTQIAGPVVTTPLMDVGPADRLDAAESLVQIAGRVLDASGAAVSGAWVRLEDGTGEPLQVTHSDASGRFTFDGLRPDQYRLCWRAQGFAVPTTSPRVVQVPSPTGDYDLPVSTT